MFKNDNLFAFVMFVIAWVLSGVIMQYTIVERIEDKGSYSAWFGEKILIFEQEK